MRRAYVRLMAALRARRSWPATALRVGGLIAAVGLVAALTQLIPAQDQGQSDVVGDAQVKAATQRMLQDAAARQSLPGAKLFADHCATCHLVGV